MRRIVTLSVLALLLLPAKAAAETFPVTTKEEAGPGSLREAIEEANSNAGLDTIEIGLSGAIELEAALPAISDDVKIRGPGADQLTVRRKAGSGEFRIIKIVCCPEVTISGLTIANGLAPRGAGVESTAVLTLERVVVTENEATASGGSTAATEGGGILSEGSLVLRESTVSGNRAVASNGVAQTVASDAGMVSQQPTTVDRSTIAGNVAEASSATGEVKAQGGGIGLSFKPTIEGSTIAGNGTIAVGGTTNVAQGANLMSPSSTLVRDTIVSDPHGAPSCSQPVASGGFNVEDGTSCGFAQPTDLSSTNPGLAPALAANGGPTPTFALEPGSLAVDHGNAFGATTDQRGRPRISDFGAIPNVPGGDGSDTGAFELQDEIAPVAKIETGPLPRTRRLLAHFTFSSNEPGSRFECRIDHGASFPCSSPYTRRVRRNRTHLFEVEAIDLAGNRSVPAWRSWRVMHKLRRHHHHQRRLPRNPWVT